MNQLFLRKICVSAVWALVLSATFVPALADSLIAQDGSPSHTLLYITDAPGETIQLSPGTGLFDGLFAGTDPGWSSPLVDSPPDYYALLPGHQVSLQRLSFDPGFSMYFPFTGSQILATDGSIYTFNAEASGVFDNDLIYAADGPIGTTYSATFRLVDPSGLHSPSDSFTLDFVAVPEPATAGLLVFGGIAFLRRRSRR